MPPYMLRHAPRERCMSTQRREKTEQAPPPSTGRETLVHLPSELLALLRLPSTCYLATSMPDGSPQLTQTWVDTDGTHVLINSVRGHVKTRNIGRDPRVAVAVSDPDNPSRFFQVRGRVVETTTEGAVEHVEKLAQKYLGEPYPWYGGRDEERVLFVIAPESISSMG
ncbi:PPOX class F420-dependent oxidoreductase [Streptomyces nigrescens]